MPITKGLGSTGDVYAELGVTPLVNIVGTVTVIGGSVMKPEVMELIGFINRTTPGRICASAEIAKIYAAGA